MGSHILSNLKDRLVDACVDVFGPTPDLRGPLTSSPRAVPGPARVERASSSGASAGPPATDLVPSPPVVACQGATAGTATSAGRRPPSPNAPGAHGPSPRPSGLARLQAWDCILDTNPVHRCVTRSGDPIRAGQSCYPSAYLMGQKGFPARFPALYAKAVLLEIITPDEVA